MIITPQQRRKIDQLVEDFRRDEFALVEIDVHISQAHDSDNVLVSLYHPGTREDHKDFSYLGTQLMPDGYEPWAFEEAK